MNTTSECAAAQDANAKSSKGPHTPVAMGVADVVGSWASLLNLELILARRSLLWLLTGAIAIPVAGVGAWLSFSALLVTLTHTYTNSWLLALMLGCGVQLIVLAALLDRLQRWAHDLTLPHSRMALARALKRMT
jgi:hypothetical protein